MYILVFAKQERRITVLKTAITSLYNTLFYRPHVVTAKWLLESFSKGYLHPVEQYIPLNYQLLENPILEQPGMKSILPKNNSLLKKEAVNVIKHQKAADDDFLSQYVNNDSTLGMFLAQHTIESLTAHNYHMSFAAFAY